MEQVITTERIPIKMWLDDIEEGALEQAKNIANLPFVFRHIALMGDCHLGYGMPIGGVMATTPDVIVPNAVGVDIGCGMCAVRTSLTDLDTPILKNILGHIRETVPVGFNHHKEPCHQDLMPGSYNKLALDGCEVVTREYAKARYQLGTLGGGNHFVEIQEGSDGHVWIMIHSGSRNLGYQVAKHYNNIAIKLNSKWYSSVPKKHELAFLIMGGKDNVFTDRGTFYYREMCYCVKFAYANRKMMMQQAQNAIEKELPDTTFEPMINIAHNYASLEHHFKKNVMVHRKGATQAYEEQWGIIPGSQGTNSYIVQGKGCRESFMSCSHGAGRKMGRKQAQRELSFKEEIEQLDKLGILHSIRSEKDLDEAPGAYKNIKTVMENQKDLVKIVVELSPLGVVKG